MTVDEHHGLKTWLDHDDFGLNQSKVIVIDSKSLARNAGGKPGAIFPHPTLVYEAASGAPSSGST
jgi:hypothetical protein